MKRFVHILQALLIGVLTPVTSLYLSACSDNTSGLEPDEVSTPGLVQIGFLVNVGDVASSGITRAPGSGDYHPGSGFENYIDVESGDYRIYLFTQDNIFAFALNPAQVSPLQTLPNSKQYLISAEITSDNLTGFNSLFFGKSMKVVMLANWRNYPDADLIPGLTTIDDIIQSAQNISEYKYIGAEVNKETRIPMYGVAQYDDVTPADGLLYMLGDLHLLRSLAKVEVWLSAKSEAEIESVSLTRHNNKFFSAPQGIYHQNQYVTGSYLTDYLSAPHIPDSAEVTTELTLEKNANGHYLAYIPEYRNKGSRAQHELSRLKVKFRNDSQLYYVDFKYYDNPPAPLQGIVSIGDRFDILRNNWYRFELNLTPRDLEVHVDIQPYATVDLDADFGLMRDSDGNLIVVRDAEGNFPASFLSLYSSRLPKWDVEETDYYVIIMDIDGNYENNTVVLRDAEGCEVQGDFHHVQSCPQSCAVRDVILTIRTTGEKHLCEKDLEHDRRLQHNDDHSSVCYDPQGRLLYKNLNGERYAVESWDAGTGKFYIEKQSSYIEIDRSGKPTGKTISK